MVQFLAIDVSICTASVHKWSADTVTQSQRLCLCLCVGEASRLDQLSIGQFIEMSICIRIFVEIVSRVLVEFIVEMVRIHDKMANVM